MMKLQHIFTLTKNKNRVLPSKSSLAVAISSLFVLAFTLFFSSSASALSYSDFLTDKLELKFVKGSFERTTDVSFNWSAPLISRHIEPYSHITYSSTMTEQIDRVADEFKQLLRNNEGSWWVVSDQSHHTSHSYSGKSGEQWMYSFYFHPNKRLRFSELSNNGYVTFFDDNGPIRNVTQVTIRYNATLSSGSYMNYTFVNETPIVSHVFEKNISSFRLTDKHKLFLANVYNSSELGLPSSLKPAESFPVFDTEVYPRFSIYYENSTLLATVDSDYFSEIGIPIPDVNLFVLVRPDGSILQPNFFHNGIAKWTNVPNGNYRVILHSAYHDSNPNKPEGYILKPSYFDVSLDPNEASFFLYFDKTKQAYCFGSNRLRSNDIDSVFSDDPLTWTNESFRQLLSTAIPGSNYVGGELYHRCSDTPDPQFQTDPSDFSQFSPQGFSDYTKECPFGDIGCHLSNFLINLSNKFVSIFRYLFVPRLDDIQRSISGSLDFLKSSMGGLSGLYSLFEGLINSFFIVLVPSLDTYAPPCNIFNNISFVGASVNLDICILERLIGSSNFQALTLMISVGMFFSASLLIRATFLTVLGNLGPASSKGDD